MSKSVADEPIGLRLAILTVSDTRDEETDTSGNYLQQAVTEAGHRVYEKTIVRDDVYQIRAIASRWIACSDVEAILVTGGTGFSGRDSTPEALQVLFDKDVVGFGELFRQLSYEEIGTCSMFMRMVRLSVVPR